MMSLIRHILTVAALASTLSSCASILVGIGAGDNRSEAKIERQREENRTKWEGIVPGIMPWADSLRAAGVMKDTFMMKDGVRLHAVIVYAEQKSPRTAIVQHGYTAGPENVMPIVRMYRDSLGFNVLFPSLRHHGYSEGDHVQMGWEDRFDMLAWSEQAHRMFGDTAQVFHGVSMGAATVMMASGEDTPVYVKGFVEDCGYTSAWEELIFASDRYLHKDARFVARAEKCFERRYGLNLHEASSTSQLAKCSKPMLFIHGDADNLVPVWMAFRNFDAKTLGYKELWIVPGAAHSRSFPSHTAEYTARVRAFVNNILE